MNDEQNALLSKNKWKQSERARQTNPDQTWRAQCTQVITGTTDVKTKESRGKKKLCHNKNAKRVCPPTHVQTRMHLHLCQQQSQSFN